jgi:serine/threonine-protein kinase
VTDLAALSTALAGRYTLVREVGAGGMATVYLARDLKHDRNVALKVLKPELGAVLGVERFLAEIKVTANLQHPNLLPLFDSGEANGLLFYVMPFVEGETLRARLDREKQLPVDEAVRLATAIAGALAYAHERGVIHRDLKPENILLQAGQPVIADFGIALAVSNAGGARVTQTGLSLGTPQYMSPEQATGDRVIDARSDIYSLSAMTYEMLVGDPPHVASTAQAIVAKLLTERPPSVQVARPTVGDAMADAIDRGLEKLPADRWSSAAEFAEALRGRLSTGATRARTRVSGVTPSGMAGAPRWMRWALGGSMLFGVLGAAAAVWLATRPAAPPQPAVFPVVMPESVSVTAMPYLKFAIAPDGSALVVTGNRVGAPRALYLRRLTDPVARLVQGTDSTLEIPTFSPDGQWLLFRKGTTDANRLMRVPVTGGTPQLVSDSGTFSASWGDGDVIVVRSGSGLYRTTSTGGAFRLLAQPDSGRRIFRFDWPHVLPGGTHALLTVNADFSEQGRLGVVSLADGSIEELGIVGSNAQFVAPDRIVYGAPGGLVMTAPFSLRARRVTGPSERVAEGVAQGPLGAVQVAASRNGVLAVLAGGSESDGRESDMVMVTDKGVERPTAIPRRSWREVRISPDGRQVASTIVTVQGNFVSHVWVADLASGTTERLTTDSMTSLADWTRDGRAVAYRSSAGVRLQAWPRSGVSTSIPDARDVEFMSTGPAGGYWAFGVNGDILIARDDSLKAPRPFIATAGVREGYPRVSPDGRLLAYVSEEGGQRNVYVQPIPGPGARARVSVAGGLEPIWSPDGTALFYRTLESPGTLMRAAIAERPRLEATRRDSLFPYRYSGYDVMPNGREFLMLKAAALDQRASAVSALTITTNWPQLLVRSRAAQSALVP